MRQALNIFPFIHHVVRSHLPRLARVLLLVLASAVHAQGIPAEVDAALARAKVPRDAVTLLVVDASGKAAPRLSYRASTPMNPASVTKLVTTYAALDLLGPAFTWSTPVYVDGPVQGGTLKGNLYIKGQGDPKLVYERLWLLLRRVQGLGIKTIAGDIVLDRSAFDVPEADPGTFDGDASKSYNAGADALLINYKSVVMTFVPDRDANVAMVNFEPPLAGVQLQASVPLSKADCGDYRGSLKANTAQPGSIRFGGSYPASCGEKVWPVAYADPKSYGARSVEGLWTEMGGKLGGSVHEGRVPAGLISKPTFEMTSPTLTEVIRDINKYSNNVMAQQLFLTLGLQARDDSGALQNTTTTPDIAREVVRRWWKARLGADDLPTLDNGSGLSRHTRISANALAHLLQTAYLSPVMPELMSSLPIIGTDGTLKKSKTAPQGVAHLKTGTLNDVSAMAGYVDGASGKRYVMVAIANHPNASAARNAFELLVDWVVRDN